MTYVQNVVDVIMIGFSLFPKMKILNPSDVVNILLINILEHVKKCGCLEVK